MRQAKRMEERMKQSLGLIALFLFIVAITLFLAARY
jgi:hypothetical protein